MLVSLREQPDAAPIAEWVTALVAARRGVTHRGIRRGRAGSTVEPAPGRSACAGRRRGPWCCAADRAPERVHLVHGAGGPLGGDDLALTSTWPPARGCAVRSAAATARAAGCRDRRPARWTVDGRVGAGGPPALGAGAHGRVRRGGAGVGELRVTLAAGAAATVLREVVVLGRHGQRGGRYRGELARRRRRGAAARAHHRARRRRPGAVRAGRHGGGACGRHARPWPARLPPGRRTGGGGRAGACAGRGRSSTGPAPDAAGRGGRRAAVDGRAGRGRRAALPRRSAAGSARSAAPSPVTRSNASVEDEPAGRRPSRPGTPPSPGARRPACGRGRPAPPRCRRAGPSRAGSARRSPRRRPTRAGPGRRPGSSPAGRGAGCGSSARSSVTEIRTAAAVGVPHVDDDRRLRAPVALERDQAPAAQLREEGEKSGVERHGALPVRGRGPRPGRPGPRGGRRTGSRSSSCGRRRGSRRTDGIMLRPAGTAVKSGTHPGRRGHAMRRRSSAGGGCPHSGPAVHSPAGPLARAVPAPEHGGMTRRRRILVACLLAAGCSPGPAPALLLGGCGGVRGSRPVVRARRGGGLGRHRAAARPVCCRGLAARAARARLARGRRRRRRRASTGGCPTR